MNKSAHLFSLGSGISFLGALPPGILNVTAFSLALSSSVIDALLFSLAAVLIELIFVRISLWQKFQFNGNVQRIMMYAFMIMLLLVGLTHLLSPSDIQTAIPSIVNPILSGLLLSALNPLQIPFWIAANNALIRKNLKIENKEQRLLYISGIALGSLASFVLFIFLGVFFKNSIVSLSPYLNTMIGILYLLFAIFIITRFLFSKTKNQLINA